MKRAPKSSGNLYQVDFVAALFSGMLLVWLSGIAQSEAPPDSPRTIPFLIRGELAYPNGQILPLLPSTALNIPCLNPDFLKQLFPDVAACQTETVWSITNAPNVKSLYESIEAKTDSAAPKASKSVELNLASGKTIEAYGSPLVFELRDGTTYIPTFLGLAVGQPLAVGRTPYVAIGLLPKNILDKHVSAISFAKIATDKVIITVPSDEINGTRKLLSFLFPDLISERLMTFLGDERPPSGISMTVLLRVRGQKRCLEAGEAGLVSKRISLVESQC